jgi:hopene-associated glycosyltransferase HpnB
LGLAIGIVSVAVWGYLLFGRGDFWRSPVRAADIAPASAAATPNGVVTAVIPARDEAESIASAVASLRAQTYPGVLRIIVVDDSSSDATAEIAQGRGATVVRGLPLAPGWSGKVWALVQGVERALQDNPDYLLLTDADVVHAADNVSQLIRRAEASRFDLVSLMVLLRCESRAERLMMPGFVFFFLMLYPPAWIENGRYLTAGAAGGCMLIRREMLQRIGGIATIRGELIDDCALARAVKRSGGRVWLGLTRQTRSIRAYGSFGAIWQMISRTAFTQLDYSLLKLAGTLAGLALTFVAPPVLVFTRRWPAAALGAAAWFSMSAAYAPMLRFYGISRRWAPVLPLVALFYAGATIDSAVRFRIGRGGEWKGRAQAART